VAFKTLEREGAMAVDTTAATDTVDSNPVLRYWDALHLVTKAEIDLVRSNGGMEHDQNHNNGTNPDDENGNTDQTTTPTTSSPKAMVEQEIQNMFQGQSTEALEQMKADVEAKVNSNPNRSIPNENGGISTPAGEGEGGIDMRYWKTVLDQLVVHLAKLELSDIHSKMLVCQLEKLEKRKEELGKATGEQQDAARPADADADAALEGTPNDDTNSNNNAKALTLPKGVDLDFGNLEEELGLADEIDCGTTSFAWQEKYRPRKPRYFNRVKTGYDWNKYNQTHYDHDNPPPKTVQGYKFNVFYPDLIDKTKTPLFLLEATEHTEFCIIRFRAGPPYEDVAFKIINRQWNRSRKRGYRSTFERGVLTLYFNFASHWYRR